MANIRDVQMRVDENSRVARLTAWHAGGRSRPLSGFGRQGVGGRVAISVFTMEGALVREGTKQVDTSGLAAGN